MMGWFNWPCGRQQEAAKGQSPDGIKIGVSERMHPYQLSVVDLALLNVAGKEDDNAAQLRVRTGVAGTTRTDKAIHRT